MSALCFEMFEKIYFARMSIEKAEQIIEDNTNYDDDENLKDNIREKYEDDYSDIEYLSENENYEDD